MTDVATTQRIAGGFLIGAGSDLMLASSPRLSADERRFYAMRAFSTWPSACAAMAELEPLMPRSAEAGYDRADQIAAVKAQHSETTS